MNFLSPLKTFSREILNFDTFELTYQGSEDSDFSYLSSKTDLNLTFEVLMIETMIGSVNYLTFKRATKDGYWTGSGI